MLSKSVYHRQRRARQHGGVNGSLQSMPTPLTKQTGIFKTSANYRGMHSETLLRNSFRHAITLQLYRQSMLCLGQFHVPHA